MSKRDIGKTAIDEPFDSPTFRPMTIGERIRERREGLGIPDELAFREESYLSGFHSDEIIRLAQALQCSADYLLGLTDNPEPYER